tara:strand:+ start:1999 stop:2511 length:513 start_codon:yes stop_codon:yes gene_type:complete
MALYHPPTPIVSRSYASIFWANTWTSSATLYLVVDPMEVTIEPGCTQVYFLVTDWDTNSSSGTWCIRCQEESPGREDWAGYGNPALSTPPGTGVVFPTPPMAFGIPQGGIFLGPGDSIKFNYPVQSDRPGTFKLWASGHGDLNPISGGGGAPGVYQNSYLVVVQVIGNSQ